MKNKKLNLKEKWLDTMQEALIATDEISRGLIVLLWHKSKQLPRKKKKKQRKNLQQYWNTLNELAIK